MTTENAQRYDICGIDARLDSALSDGKLRVNCCITNVGVFTYRNADGTLRRELRCPEEVFKQDSMDSLKGVPMTNLHHGLLDEKNVDKFKVGHLDDDVTCDAYHLFATINVEDEAAVEDVTSGTRRSLSAGYTCRLERTPGTWMGVNYDCIQRDIVYNHVALVHKGRAGDDAVIHMDGIDDDCVCVGEINREETMNKQTIRIDEAEVEVDASVAAFIEKKDAEISKLNEDMASIKADKDKMEAERDSANEECKAFKERLDSMEKEQPSIVAAAVKSRLALVSKVKALGVEVNEDMDEDALRTATIAKAYPNRNLEGKSRDYIESCFDCACDMLGAAHEEVKNSRADSADVPEVKPVEHKPTARDRYCEKISALAMKR